MTVQRPSAKPTRLPTIDAFARAHLAWTARVRRLAAPLSDAELDRLAGDLEERGRQAFADWAARTAEQLRAEQGYRYGLRRARELGCDAYCAAHDCDTRACPAGAHE